MFSVHRSKENPLISPQKEISWQSVATCNGSPIKIGAKTHILYRAIASKDRMKNIDLHPSVIGRAVSKDGEHFSNHQIFIEPEQEWEQFGCEDPRVTKLERKYYTFYTALSTYPLKAEGIRVGVAVSKDLEKVQERHLVTPFNAKAMTLFPKRIKGKLAAILSVNTDNPPSEIAIRYFDKPEDIWNNKKWDAWYKKLPKHTLPLKRNNSDQVEVGATPLYTKDGWLLIYSHITNYFSPERNFGIEAVLLDLNNPQKIIGRTKYPLIIPEEVYEHYGHVQNIVFPTGVLLNKGVLDIYYGASDTTICKASLQLKDLLSVLTGKMKPPVTRFEGNPILSPIAEHQWEARDVFNPAAIELDNSIHLLYRAMSPNNTSVFGYAKTKDGQNITQRDTEPVYVPREDFEQKKSHPTGNSGCEDPRLSRIGNRIYMCYTAYNGIQPPRVAITSISVADFRNKKWNWDTPITISANNIDDKDACILPERINGSYMILHRIASHICADFSTTLNFTPGQVDTCIEIFGPRKGMWDSLKVGIASPPHKTKDGWLLLYHGVGDDHGYRVGAALLDLKDPTHIIGRTALPIFEPETSYEKEGEINNVVFPCGSVVRKNKLFIYYGAADKTVGVATTSLSNILKMVR